MLLASSWFVFCWMTMDSNVPKDGGSAPKKARVSLKLKCKPGIPVTNAMDLVAFVEPVTTDTMNPVHFTKPVTTDAMNSVRFVEPVTNECCEKAAKDVILIDTELNTKWAVKTFLSTDIEQCT